jgi:hypothetical protein
MNLIIVVDPRIAQCEFTAWCSFAEALTILPVERYLVESGGSDEVVAGSFRESWELISTAGLHSRISELASRHVILVTNSYVLLEEAHWIKSCIPVVVSECKHSQLKELKEFARCPSLDRLAFLLKSEHLASFFDLFYGDHIATDRTRLETTMTTLSKAAQDGRLVIYGA